MSARKSHLDQAIDKLTEDIKVLELARQRLIVERTARDRKKPSRPQVVEKKAAGA